MHKSTIEYYSAKSIHKVSSYHHTIPVCPAGAEIQQNDPFSVLPVGIIKEIRKIRIRLHEAEFKQLPK